MLGEGPTDDVKGSLGVTKKKFSINYSNAKTKFYLSLHYNHDNSSALPVYDDRYIKTKIRTYLDKVSTHFRGLYVPEDDVEYESFTIIFMYSLPVYEDKYHLQRYLDDFAYKIVNT